MNAAVAQASGNVTLAPGVLARLLSLALREVPGVASAGRVPRASHLSSAIHDGVAVRLGGDGASIDCYLLALPETNLLELGVAVQVTMAAVCEDLAGTTVRDVNVYIQDVEVRRG